ncbi:MAG: hypothetical protein LBV07_04505, partial [Syntrophobacterales bacterium]|nr:hypothetical protein [Syntrophobacterales bacterium]
MFIYKTFSDFHFLKKIYIKEMLEGQPFAALLYAPVVVSVDVSSSLVSVLPVEIVKSVIEDGEIFIFQGNIIANGTCQANC